MQKLELGKEMGEVELYPVPEEFIGEIKVSPLVKIVEPLGLEILMGQRYPTQQKLQEDTNLDII